MIVEKDGSDESESVSRVDIASRDEREQSEMEVKLTESLTAASGSVICCPSIETVSSSSLSFISTAVAATTRSASTPDTAAAVQVRNSTEGETAEGESENETAEGENQRMSMRNLGL